MSVYGADVEQLDQLGRKFSEESEKIKQAISMVSGQLANVFWKGPDADRFRAEWDSTHKAALNRLVESLQQASTQVKRQAAEQRRVSGG